MTSTDAPAARPAFGVNERIGETFSVLRQRFMTFVILSAVPGILVELASYATGLGTGFEADPFAPGQATPSVFIIILVSAILPMLLYSIMTGMMVLAAYDTKSGRPVRLEAYLKAVIRRLPALILVTLVASFGVAIAFMLFIVPGLWLAGAWAVCVPVVMIEGMGFGALARSRQLTKEYRWPIIGFVVVAYIIIFVITFLVALAAGLLPIPMLLVAIVLGLINGVATALISIAVSVAYARLRDIKEGVGYADLAEVFD